MKQELLLQTRLEKYAKSNYYPLHMPGHKRQLEFPNPFAIDITEIDGFDNLHHAEDILKESMDWAASVYGVKRSFYLVNGSSCGILSAMFATTTCGGTILMSRNCHKSAYHGVILRGLKTEYVYPQIIEEMGIQGAINPEDVEKALEENPQIQAVLIVSPTYDGVVSDIETIAKIVHKKQIPLIVDEAHGAHFPFGEAFPRSAIGLGADIVIQSVHKTLPSLTQTAVLHVTCSFIKEERLEQYLSMFQTSSPSYVFLSSIESCIYQMEQSGREQMNLLANTIKGCRINLKPMKHLKLLNETHGIVDLSKFVISCRNCGRSVDGDLVAITGIELGDWLRKEFFLEMELCGADYVVAILTCMDTREGFERLENALLAIDQKLVWVEHEKVNYQVWNHRPQVKISMSQANGMEGIPCKLEESGGKIAAEFVYLYPPGIPMIAPGELIEQHVLDAIFQYKKMKLPVEGLVDKQANYMKVIEVEKING